MKRYSPSLLLSFILLGAVPTCLAQTAGATGTSIPAASPIPSVAATPSPTPAGLHLKDKFAIGTDTIRLDENSPQLNTSFLTSTQTSLDAIWWFSDDLGLDILATGSISQTPSVDYNGNNYDYPTDILGGGLGLRQNLSSPLRDLEIQGLLRFTYAHYDTRSNLWYYTAGSPSPISLETGAAQSETYTLMLGLGFEYFLPFCESLSVQSYLAYAVGYNDNNGTVTYNPNLANYGYTGYINTNYQSSYWRTALLLNGLSLSSLAVHFYF